MTKSVAAILHDFTFPAKEPPAWHAKVERWYQLDAAAYGLCELVARIPFQRPEMIFLASPGGCNETDFAFARHGAAQPAKFVHTLPNVRGSVLLQVLNWQGPLLCVQDDPLTIELALSQAALFGQSSWVIGTSGRTAFCLSVGESAGDFAIAASREPGIQKPVLDWMREGNRAALDLPMNMQLCFGGRPE